MVAVIGDVHGCYYTLKKLVEVIEEEFQGIEIYLVGDLVDRGNNSFEVLEYVIDRKLKFTPGNHDYMFFHFFEKPTSLFARSWMFNGHEATLESYENKEKSIPDHLKIIKSAPLFFNLDDCFISHAGISHAYSKSFSRKKGIKREVFLEEIVMRDFETDKGVLWTRNPLLDIGKMQVIGHTKQKEVTLDRDSNSVYIDTGACLGNKLSSVIIENSQIVKVIEIKTELQDII